MRHITDRGPCPFVLDIDHATKENDCFRVTVWTGHHLQVTLMSIPRNSDIGCEIHNDTDQFIRCEAGSGRFITGCERGCQEKCTEFESGDALFIPAGTWHNIVNTGNCPLKLYSIYAPPHHPHGTVHRTKADSERDSEHSGCNCCR